MPAPSTIEASIKSWIGTTTTASTRVSVGSRVQFQALPAIVFEVTSGDYAAFNNDGALLQRWEANIKAIAETAIDAESLCNTAYTRIVTGAAPSVIHQLGLRIIEEPIIGEGDESQPAVCTLSIAIFREV